MKVLVTLAGLAAAETCVTLDSSRYRYQRRETTRAEIQLMLDSDNTSQVQSVSTFTPPQIYTLFGPEEKNIFGTFILTACFCIVAGLDFIFQNLFQLQRCTFDYE